MYDLCPSCYTPEVKQAQAESKLQERRDLLTFINSTAEKGMLLLRNDVT